MHACLLMVWHDLKFPLMAVQDAWHMFLISNSMKAHADICQLQCCMSVVMPCSHAKQKLQSTMAKTIASNSCRLGILQRHFYNLCKACSDV